MLLMAPGRGGLCAGMNCEVPRATLPDRINEVKLQRFERQQCMDPHAAVCNHRPAAQHLNCKTRREALCSQLRVELGATAVASAQRPCITETGELNGARLGLGCRGSVVSSHTPHCLSDP